MKNKIKDNGLRSINKDLIKEKELEENLKIEIAKELTNNELKNRNNKNKSK